PQRLVIGGQRLFQMAGALLKEAAAVMRLGMGGGQADRRLAGGKGEVVLLQDAICLGEQELGYGVVRRLRMLAEPGNRLPSLPEADMPVGDRQDRFDGIS